MATPTKKRTPRQKTLPKMGPVKNAKIEALAERYVEAREAWMALKTPFINARDLLEVAMKESNIAQYEFDGKIVEFDGPDPHVKVRTKKADKDEA